jgi:futalosine hydrolase
MPDVLLVAATEIELCEHPGFVCGIGPVEAAVSVARELTATTRSAVLHVGLAGGRKLTPGALVVGTEAIYADLSAEIPVVDRLDPDPKLIALAQAALPEAISLPIATSATVSRPETADHEFRVEAMEGFAVLRACELAGVPAVEVRAVCNEIGEGDRALWMMRRGLEVLSDALPRLLAVMSK